MYIHDLNIFNMIIIDEELKCIYKSRTIEYLLIFNNI